MRENDITINLADIEKKENTEIYDIKSPLVLFNLGSSKYVAALRAANVLSSAGISNKDWELFRDIVLDTDSFLSDPTEVDFIQDIFLQVLYNTVEDVDIVMNDEILNVSAEEYERFYEYVVSRDEIEIFKNIYIDFIYKAVAMYKERHLNFNITLKLSNRWIYGVYKSDKSFKEKIEHFKKSFYAFWIFNGFQNVSVYFKRGIFGCTYLTFEVGEIV